MKEEFERDYPEIAKQYFDMKWSDFGMDVI